MGEQRKWESKKGESKKTAKQKKENQRKREIEENGRTKENVNEPDAATHRADSATKLILSVICNPILVQ